MSIAVTAISKTASEKRLEKLATNLRARDLAKAYQISLESTSEPQSVTKVVVEEALVAKLPVIKEVAAIATPIAESEKTSDAVQNASDAIIETTSTDVTTKQDTKPEKSGGLRFIWWFTHEEGKATISGLSKKLTGDIGRFKKVPDGGWVVDGNNCRQQKGPKKCNGIIISQLQKDELEKKEVPGTFELLKK